MNIARAGEFFKKRVFLLLIYWFEKNNLVSSHTTSPVPLIITDKKYSLKERGKLADLAPTILYILGENKPNEMTGENLIIEREDK